MEGGKEDAVNDGLIKFGDYLGIKMSVLIKCKKMVDINVILCM